MSELGPVAMARKNKLRATLFDETAAVTRFGRYTVLGTLGRGGMGTVLEAFDPTLDRRVAVKVLHLDVADRHAQRLVREAQALARLSHPNVVQVYEVADVEGRTFVAMELIRGRTLQQWVAQDPPPGWKACVELYLQAGAGLAAAHAQGLVHRDFKPTNAIVDDGGRVRVLDFGLARRAQGIEDELASTDVRPQVEGSALDASLTSTGTVLGTLAYMPLEQMKGEEADARSDQFSFCVSLYEAVFGLRPYPGKSLLTLTVSMTTGGVQPPPKGVNVPAALRRALLRGLATDPDQRWPSMDALLVELQRLVAPRVWRWLGLGVAGGLVAVGVGLAWYAEVGFRCEGARAQLDGIWDEGRKQELEAAIVGTEVSYATETWARVESQLDAHANDWVAKHTEVCEATRVTQAQPEAVMALRMGCLSSRRMALRAVVDVLSRADPTRVSNAAELVASLPELSRCDDVEALQAELPPPEDPELVERVEAQRERLAEAWALRLAGDYRGSSIEADAVVEQAETLGYGPLQAEARLRRGQASDTNGDYAQAEQDLEQAYLLAEEHEHHEVELGSVLALVHVVGHQQGRHERARQWGTVAMALARRTRTSPRTRAEVQHEMGVLLADEGKLEEALEQLESALAIQREVLGPRHAHVANTLNNIGVVLERNERWSEAREHYQQALAIREQVSGPHHPNVASSLANLANVLFVQGRLEEALEHHQRALAIRERALGPGHPNVAASESDVGNVLHRLGRRQEALEHQRRALTIREASLGAGHLDVAISLTDLAIALDELGKREEALTSFLRALDIQEDELGPRHPEIAAVSTNIGFVLAGLGRHEEALEYHQRALVIAEESMGPQSSTVASILDNLGDVLVVQAKLEDAKQTYQRALVIAEQSLGKDNPLVAYSLVGLAEVALREHDHAAALPHAERALSVREAGEVAPTELAQARFLLARALWSDPAEHTRARTLAEQARDGYAAYLEGSETQLAEVVAWLAERE